MHPHAYAQRAGLTPRFVLERQLCLEARLQAIWGSREYGHQAVTRDLDYAPISLLHRGTEDRVVTFHGGLHRVGKLLPQPCARLEISEDERKGFGRGVAVHRAGELRTHL